MERVRILARSAVDCEGCQGNGICLQPWDPNKQAHYVLVNTTVVSDDGLSCIYAIFDLQYNTCTYALCWLTL